MRTLCDVCESAAAILFCAADEAALCQSCDDKVHLCNKLAGRHVRVKLANPSGVGHCDICENVPAFFYCEIDGSSLCLQCDMIVHVGGKRTHERYLLFRQKVEFPGDKPELFDDLIMQPINPSEVRLEKRENLQNRCMSSVPVPVPNNNELGKMESKMIDLNARPNQINGQTSNNQVQSLVMVHGYCEESASIPRGSFKREPTK